METSWFVRMDKGIAGPISTAQLIRLARERQIEPDTFVRKSPDGKWVKAGNVRGLFAVESPGSTSTSATSARPVDALESPAGFFGSLFGSWRHARGHWAWVLPLAIVGLPLSSLAKPHLGIRGLIGIICGLAALTIILRLLFLCRHIGIFYWRGRKQVRKESSLVARLGRLSLLLAVLVGCLTAAEYFGSEEGLVAALAAKVTDASKPEQVSTTPVDSGSGDAKRVGSGELRGADPPPEPSPVPAKLGDSTWAILIGVRDYKSIPRLRLTVNDVKQLGESLVKFGSVPRNHILEITDDDPIKPDFAVLVDKISEALANPELGPDDQVIVYFSGHGLLSPADQTMYLAPRDLDLKNIKNTGISAAWLREELRACPARVKLLWLDACHSGSNKSAMLIGARLAQELSYAPGVITISACNVDQYSWESTELNHGLFTYFLIEALSGRGDVNQDRFINIDELYGYVSARVPGRALQDHGMSQDPVRWIPFDITGVPMVVQLPAEQQKLSKAPKEVVTEPIAAHRDLGGRIGAELAENFSDAPGGELPAGWAGDSLIGVRSDGDKAWLQPSKDGWHYVRASPINVWGDFQLEMNFYLSAWADLRVTLEGPGATDVKAGISREGGGGTGYLVGAQRVDVQGLAEPGKTNRLTIQRVGNVYILRLDGKFVTQKRVDQPGRLQHLWLETNQHDALISDVTIQSAMDKQAIEPPRPVELFFQDFAKAKQGTLPDSWQGPPPLGVVLDGSLGWLRTSKDGTSSALVRLPSIRGDFELASRFLLAPWSSYQISLLHEGRPPVSVKISHSGGGAGSAILADAKPEEFNGMGDYLSRVALRREGEVFTLGVDGRELIVHRIPDQPDPSQLELTLEFATSRVYDVGVWQLPSADGLQDKSDKK
jgi:hypothetical protein